MVQQTNNWPQRRWTRTEWREATRSEVQKHSSRWVSTIGHLVDDGFVALGTKNFSANCRQRQGKVIRKFGMCGM